jgi:hypothetical protein
MSGELDSVLDEPTDRGPAIDAAAGEAKAKRGRPPGSKTKVDRAAERAILRQRYAGLTRALFIVSGIVAGWFGYEYAPPLDDAEAMEGAAHLEALGERFTWLAWLSTWVGAPVWFLVKFTQHFRAKTQTNAAAPAARSSDSGAPVAHPQAPPVSANGSFEPQSIPFESEDTHVVAPRQ